jgi:hypothetical protein
VNFERLLKDEPLRPRWSTASALVYIGGFVVLSATGTLFGILGESQGEWALAGYALVAGALALGVALLLQQRERDVAAGLVATLAVIFVTVSVAAFLSAIGIVDADGEGYDPTVHIVEAAILVAALLALYRFRAPLLVLVIGLTVFVTLLDIASTIPWDSSETVAALVVGALFVIAGVVLDRLGREPYGFWPHLIGALAVGGAVLDLVAEEGDWGWAVIGVVSLAYVAVAHILERSFYAVIGAVGILATTTYFTFDVVGLATTVVPFGEGGGTGADVEPWQVASWFIVAGLLIGLLGLVGRPHAPRDERDEPRLDRDELAPGV